MGASRLDTDDLALAAVLLVATVATSAIATGALVPLLRRRNLLDRPNERSSHAVPTPRGGGIALVGTLLLAWLGLAEIGRVGAAVVPVCIAAAALAALCWIDDIHDLSPTLRLVAQAAAVAIGLAALPQSSSGVQHWIGPITYDVFAGFVWLWWINAYNFMDGIDGIAGSEAAAISGGLMLVSAVGSAVDPSIVLLAAAIFGASLGFLKWNWSPARIFLGDVGSVPLGYLTGFLLIAIAGAGHWRVALILPSYFLADATITLTRRLLRGEKVWQAHREHFYQRAAHLGLGHAAVVKRVILADLCLIACGWAAENGAGAFALLAAAAIVAALLAELARRR